MAKKMKYSGRRTNRVGPCVHFSPEINQVLSRICSASDLAHGCRDCRRDSGSKKRGGSQSSDSSPSSNFNWICLDCSQGFCGGVVSDLEPFGHSRRHAKIEHHRFAVRLGDPVLCWCFACNAAMSVDLADGTSGSRDTMSSDCSAKWQKRTGNRDRDSEAVIKRVYGVRGLVNIGNTCFFNSVMQNLLAMDSLHKCLVSLEEPMGPLTMELRKLFVEVNAVEDSRGVYNPNTFFECICAKAPQFKGYQQQDSHEFLRCLLDELHNEATVTRRSLASWDDPDRIDNGSRTSFVDALFGGQLLSSVSCMECGHTSVVYEPYLDLSLPVPSKRPPSRKFSATRNKRNKVKSVVNTSPNFDLQQRESFGSQSGCNEAVGLDVEKNVAAIDCLGSTIVMDGADSVYQKCEVTIAQRLESEQIYENENNMNWSLDSQNRLVSKELAVSSDSCGENSCKDDAQSSCIQDSGVISVPYKEDRSKIEEINGTISSSHNLNNVGLTNDDVTRELSIQTASVAGCRAEETEFEGIKNLLNDPEITSDLKTGFGVSEVATALCIGNGAETDREVDRSCSPVSVDGCLALFIKPELLSDDHAWYCERCSDISSGDGINCRKIARLDQSGSCKSQRDVGKMKSTGETPSLEVDCIDSIGIEVTDCEKRGATSRKLAPSAEILNDANTCVDADRAPISFTMGSTYEDGIYLQAKHQKIQEKADQVSAEHRMHVLQKDEEVADSDCSQYLSCPSNHDNPSPQVSSGNQDNDSCSVNEPNCLGSDVQTVEAALNNSPGRTETLLQSSCENDNFSEVNQVDKKGQEMLSNVHVTKNIRGKLKEARSRKVKRDATKRILINKAPPILTIHLKRFNQDANGRLNKLGGHVIFQEKLELRPYMDPRCEEESSCYQLIGVVEHSGSMTRGHYVAYVRADRSQVIAPKSRGPTWFYASDTLVREVSLPEVLKSEAYILFYERVSV